MHQRHVEARTLKPLEEQMLCFFHYTGALPEWRKFTETQRAWVN